MPTLEQRVINEDGKPRKFVSTLTFYPEDAVNLESSEMIAGIRDHWTPEMGFFRPDPEKDDDNSFIKVYFESYERDDSNPAAKKRHIVEIEIPGEDFVNS